MDKECSTYKGEAKYLYGQKGKRSLGIPRSRCENTVRLDLRERRFDDMVWIHLAEDRALVNTKMNFRVEKILSI
jgi:hypothetical protein